jgi:hypothetical protein
VVVVYVLIDTSTATKSHGLKIVVVVVVVGGIVVDVVVVVGTKQSKIASKSNTSQGDVVVVVVVGQVPDVKKDSSKSGQLENDPVGPN